jgi:hypothetical protein
MLAIAPHVHAAAMAIGEAPVYRCGNLFTQTPCPDAQTLDYSDSRSDAERRQGEDVAAREKRLAAALEAERHARERLPPLPKQAQAHVQPVCVAASGPARGKVVACPARKSRDKAGKTPSRRASEPSWTIVRVPAPPPSPRMR